MIVANDTVRVWKESIPEHWQIMPLKHAITYNDDKLSDQSDNDYEFDYVDIGSVTYGKGIESFQHMKFGDAPSRARRIVQPKDVIMSTVRTYLKATAKIEEHDNPIIVSTGFMVMRARNGVVLPDFLGYVAQSDGLVSEIECQSYGTSYPAINAGEIANLSIPVPPLSEQHAIVVYLDQKCAAIDEAIDRHKKIIEELEEYRRAEVTRAVIHGILGDVPMKSVTSPWIKEIPQTWEFIPMKQLFQVVDIRNDDPNALLLSLYTAIGVRPRNELEERGNKATTVIGYKKVSSGDIIVNKLLAWMGAIAYSDYNGVTSPDYDVYRTKQGANATRDYYHYFFRYTNFKEDCFVNGHGLMMMRWRTYPDELLRIRIPNPPKEEQKIIGSYLKKLNDEIDNSIAKRNSIIRKLEEYRKSIIYNAVTGKIDCRKKA